MAAVFSIEGRGLKLDTEKDVEAFVEELGKLENVTDVRLSGNTFNVDAAKALAAALAKHRTIQRAILSDCFTGRSRDIIPPALKAFCEALAQQDDLQELDLSDNAFGPVGVESFSDLLLRARSLRRVRINNNGLGPEGGVMLAGVLERVVDTLAKDGLTLQLNSLIMGRNRLENKAASALAKVLPKIPSLTEVRLPQNGIRPEGAAVLVRALGQLKKLEVLDLQDNTFTNSASKVLAETIVEWPGLKFLNVGDCLLGAEGVKKIAQALKDSHASLEYLDLSFAEADDAAITELANSLSNKLNLQRLELDGNKFHPPTEAVVRAALAKIDKADGVLGDLDELELSDEEDEGEDEDEASGAESEEESEKAPSTAAGTPKKPSAAPTPATTPAQPAKTVTPASTPAGKSAPVAEAVGASSPAQNEVAPPTQSVPSTPAPAPAPAVLSTPARAVRIPLPDSPAPANKDVDDLSKQVEAARITDNVPSA